MSDEIIAQSVEPTQSPAPSYDGGGEFLSSVPEQYRNETFVQDLVRSEDPTTELWTKFAGMQAALQVQPGGMPSVEVAAEEWDKWASAVAPKDISLYGDVKPTLAEDKGY